MFQRIKKKTGYKTTLYKSFKIVSRYLMYLLHKEIIDKLLMYFNFFTVYNILVENSVFFCENAK